MSKFTQDARRGFTIVELLIVIVVIGILAAITIVAYTGITTQANLNAAKGNADAVRSVATTFQGENGYFPGTSEISTGGTYAKVPSGVTITSTGTLTAGNTNVYYLAKGSAGAYTGSCIGYKPANTTTIQWLYTGDATTGTEGGSPSCA